jgi:hypothetical protein
MNWLHIPNLSAERRLESEIKRINQKNSFGNMSGAVDEGKTKKYIQG